MRNFNYALVAISALCVLQSCDDDDTTDNTSDNSESTIVIPEEITVSETGLYPEGIDFNTNTNQFIIGSAIRSEVGYVELETGNYTTLVTDENLASVTGVFTDEVRNRLLVVSGNLGSSANSATNPDPLAYLGIYDLETGVKIEGINLGELLSEDSAVFANDIAVDNEGNIYVTDSFSPVIYKVDGISFEASIFVNGGDDFTPTPGAFGLNGIVYVDGNLIAAKLDNGALFKIPVADPTTYSQVAVSAFVGADGLELAADGTIVLVENGLGENTGTHTLSSSDEWDSATEVSSFEIDPINFPTTAALASDGEVYVLNAYLGLVLGGDFTQETFTITRNQ